ncbi:SURF1 family protein [Congregibacter sp.]|uniref:SURF1 family protein n=1 Tax=Congregibacter sp. TaxID=2744308 RepID=UPI00385DEDDD
MTAFKLDLEWRTTLTTALLFPGLIALGFWQLDRAQEKSELALSESQRAIAAPIDVASLIEMPTEERAYRAVTVSGEYVPDAVILLDNQIRDGRYGHDVYGVFYDQDSGQHVLLNRGWVPGDASRRSVPQVEVPMGQFTLSTSAYVPPGEPYLLAEDQFNSLEWPLLVQTVSSPALRKILRADLSGSLLATELRLLAQEPTGFRRDWPVVNVSPEKHQGYAVQWFTMAAALLVFFVIRSSNVLSLGRTGRPPEKSLGSSSDTGSAEENTSDH